MSALSGEAGSDQTLDFNAEEGETLGCGDGGEDRGVGYEC